MKAWIYILTSGIDSLGSPIHFIIQIGDNFSIQCYFRANLKIYITETRVFWGISQVKSKSEIHSPGNFLMCIVYWLNIWGMVFLLHQILNVSPNLQIAIYLESPSSPNFFQWCWRAWVSLNCTKLYFKRWARFFSTVTWVLQLHAFWNQKWLACWFS